jgi:hypothetical protein
VSKKRSDALQALVAELVEADRAIAVARDAEEEAQRSSSPRDRCSTERWPGRRRPSVGGRSRTTP